MIDAPLGMADDDGGGARIGQHFGGNVAGMGPGRQRMAVLRAKLDIGAGEDFRRPLSSVAGGQTMISASGTGVCASRLPQGAKLGQRAIQAIHLPIAGNERLDRSHVPLRSRLVSTLPRLTVFPGILGYLQVGVLAALALATYDARAAPDRPSIGRQRGFGK